MRELCFFSVHQTTDLNEIDDFTNRIVNKCEKNNAAGIIH